MAVYDGLQVASSEATPHSFTWSMHVGCDTGTSRRRSRWRPVRLVLVV